jgi:hypothetical protein
MKQSQIKVDGLYYQKNGWFRYAVSIGEKVKWYTITESGNIIGPSLCLLRSFCSAVACEATEEDYLRLQESFDKIKTEEVNRCNEWSAWIQEMIDNKQIDLAEEKWSDIFKNLLRDCSVFSLNEDILKRLK